MTDFYKVYHSMRYVKGHLILRLQSRISNELLERIRTDFADICTKGTIEQTEAQPAEANEPTLKAMPRLKFRFRRTNQGRLRQLIDVVNGG